jgi:hypothetical protein
VKDIDVLNKLLKTEKNLVLKELIDKKIAFGSNG